MCAPAAASRRRRTCAASASAPRNIPRPGSCFMRGMLQHDYGVKSEDMHWFMGGLNTFVEPPLIPLDLPKAIRLDFLVRRADAGEDVRRRRARRAALALHSEDRSSTARRTSRGCSRTSRRSSRTITAAPSIFPIMHTVVRARGRASRASVGGEEHLPRVLRGSAISRSTASTTPMRCMSRCRG